MLLNDLMQSDSVLPRLGCSRAVQVQLYDLPGVMTDIQDTFMAAPVQDPDLLRRAEEAYGRFASSRSARGNPFTLATLKKLGKNPNIELVVYRDAFGIGSGAMEYDVVRLSQGATRTYAELTVRGSVTEIDSPGLCVVGDARCAKYYEWP